jgi:hypothetical protein
MVERKNMVVAPPATAAIPRPIGAQPVLGREGTLEISGQQNALPIPIDAWNGKMIPREAFIDPATPAQKPPALPAVPMQYGSEDFKTITGQVQIWRQTVRLRYAPIDQEDPYGGFVVLEGGAELTGLRDGQHVRIRGVLIAPEGRNDTAHCRVQALEILDR